MGYRLMNLEGAICLLTLADLSSEMLYLYTTPGLYVSTLSVSRTRTTSTLEPKALQARLGVSATFAADLQ